MIKHATASTFVFCRFDEGWKLGLVAQPRLGRHMICGGHVETDESPAEAAVREVLEESGLRVRLLLRPAAPVPLPNGYPLAMVVEPWWITHVSCPADNHVAEPHVHVDHQYVAIADSPVPVSDPVHPFSWHGRGELAALRMFDDTRLLGGELLGAIESLQHGPSSDIVVAVRSALV